MTKKKEAVRIVACGTGEPQSPRAQHPGPVPEIVQSGVDDAFIEYVKGTADVGQIFAFDQYDSMRRSMQINAAGLLACRNFTKFLAKLGTGLRFKPARI